MITSFRKLLAIAGVTLLAANAGATTLDFEGFSASSSFQYGPQLTTMYADQGVTFSGVGKDGGSILDYTSNFGFPAYSGDNFLAFNVSAGVTSNVEKVAFTTAVKTVSIWGASAEGGSFTINAYNAQGTLVSSATGALSTTWSQLSVSGAGIASVQLVGNDHAYAYDNLSFGNVSAVPEPASFGMLLAGLGLMGWMQRRRRS